MEYNLNALIDVTIKDGEKDNYYLVRYRGTRRNWETSSTSAIFISIARDPNGNALYQGENERGEFKSKLAKELTALFERELINKVDKELGMQHSNNFND